MKVILWPGKGTIYTICEATWFGRTWFSPHHSFVKLVVKLGRGRTTWRCWEGCGRIRSHEDTEIHVEQGWRQVLWMEEDLPRFGWTSGTWRRRFVGRGTDYANFHEDCRTGLWFPTAFGFSFVSFPAFLFLLNFWLVSDVSGRFSCLLSSVNLSMNLNIFVTFESLKRLVAGSARRMYTDHRVMGQVVLPGVSHVSLMAATASLGFPSPGGGMGDWHISVKEVLFERPYIVHSGADLIAAIANGVDPSTIQAMAGGLPLPMTPVGVPTTYCRSTTVTKERGIIKSTMDWAKWCSMTVWLQEELTN